MSDTDEDTLPLSAGDLVLRHPYHADTNQTTDSDDEYDARIAADAAREAERKAWWQTIATLYDRACPPMHAVIEWANDPPEGGDELLFHASSCFTTAITGVMFTSLISAGADLGTAIHSRDSEALNRCLTSCAYAFASYHARRVTAGVRNTTLRLVQGEDDQEAHNEDCRESTFYEMLGAVVLSGIYQVTSRGFIPAGNRSR